MLSCSKNLIHHFKFCSFADEKVISIATVDKCLTYLKSSEFVKHVSVNSTLGRRLATGSDDLEDCVRISSKDRGKALIICNRQDRDNWEVEYKQACALFSQHLGLQVRTFNFS